jgi:serine/threonine-protein kinase
MEKPDFEYLGPYHVERVLGQGGMGTVYQGVHVKSGDRVAIKVIAAGIANQMRFRRRFAAEVETLKRLKHPNIVQLVGYGEEQGLLFYSMEYVDGHSLHDHLRQHKSLPWEDVIQVAIETTSALKHAHDIGIIHRDLKPANLMLNKEGCVKMTDFGIAKLFGSTEMTAAGAIIGTADYMPPEQAEGKTVTVRSDLYSLGGVMYALLAGKAPFGGKSVPEVLYAVRYNPAPSLLSLVPEVPQELAELIHELLEKDPQRRPPTALVVGNRLKALKQGLQRQSNTQIALPESSRANEKVATRLTSLDLSDIQDDELNLTGKERDELGLDGPTVHSDDGMGTREQQTVIAPDGGPVARKAVAGTLGAAGQSRRPDPADISGEFHSLASGEDPITSGGPSHFTPIAEDKSRGTVFHSPDVSQETGFDWIHFGSVVGMIVLLLAAIGFSWWMLSPRSADDIYQEIMVAADSGQDDAMLRAEGSVVEFLNRFPKDPRRDEIQGLADEAELLRWTRILQRRANRAGGKEELSALEQGFLEGMQLLNQDPELGRQKLAALVNVFQAVPELPRDEQKLVSLAEHALKAGAPPELEQISEATKQLTSIIQTAESTLTVEQLDSFYADLLLLYGDKSWAAEQVNRIRERLAARQ